MSHKPYRVVPHIKGMDEYFHDQLEFWQSDVLWRHNDAKTVFWRKILLLSFVIKFHHITCIGVLMTFHKPDRPIHAKGQGQGQFFVNFMWWRNPKFLSSFYRIDFKLSGNVAYTQALSWLVFADDWPWPLSFRRRVKKLTPRSKFYVAQTISCSTSN